MNCDELIEALPEPSSASGMWMWGVLFLAVLVYEVWAIKTHHRTLSQSVQGGPKWFRWAIGIGFVGLLWHLFH